MVVPSLLGVQKSLEVGVHPSSKIDEVYLGDYITGYLKEVFRRCFLAFLSLRRSNYVFHPLMGN